MKRILSLDGGGVRSFFTLQVLERVEALLREKQSDPHYRICQHFDLIAGTSAGAIIATLLSWGLSVGEVKELYRICARAIFKRAPLSQLHKHQYTDAAISVELRRLFSESDGSDALLGSSQLKTLLLIVLRNASTGSPWPLCNNPNALYNDPNLPDCNLNLPLWQLVRASAAAPTYFPCERIQIGEQSFEFIDGGVSPYNNPSFLAYQFATLPCYRIDWDAKADSLYLLSIGVGQLRPRLPKARHQDMHRLDHALHVVDSLMHSSNVQQDLACRMIGHTLHGAEIDSEIGDLRQSAPAPQARMSYVRYDERLSPPTGKKKVSYALDDLDSIPFYETLGADYAVRQVKPEHIL